MINCGDKYIQKVTKEKESLQTVAEPSEGRTTQINYRDKSDKWEERCGKVAHRKEKESVHN